MYVCMHTHVQTQTRTCIHMCIYTHIHAHIHACININTCTCALRQACTYKLLCMHTLHRAVKVSLKSVVLGQSSPRHNHSQVGQTGKFSAHPSYLAPFTPPCPLSSYPS